jgi:hypothetical protein
MEHRTQWMVKEGVMCDSCEKKEKKCFWRMEVGWGKACLACHNLKKICMPSGAELSEVEAGPSKKSKVEEKGRGKAKAKVRTLVSGVVESVVVDVLQDILKQLKGLCTEVQDLWVFSQSSVTMLEYSWRMLKQTNSHVGELVDHFVPLEADGESSRDGAENGEVHNMKMEKIGADIADIAMDETLQ